MQQNKAWLKFLITGNPNDYLKYKQTVKEKEFLRGEKTAYNNRWSGDKGNEYTG